MRKAQKLADLKNQSLMASMVNDTNWQHEICAKIDGLLNELYYQY